MATEVLAIVYVIFIVFLPISLALALVFSPDLQGGIFYATALSINWGLGVVSYFLLPAVGPIFAAPAGFADLPATEVSRLQGLMLEQRAEFLRDPAAADATQNIAAFASLHISMIFTTVVAVHLLGLGRRLRIGLWILFALSAIATIHLGWHYVVDDLAGLVLALMALALARGLTGFTPRTGWRLRIALPRPVSVVRAAAAQSGQHDRVSPRPPGPLRQDEQQRK
jgi:hypothetical protein